MNFGFRELGSKLGFLKDLHLRQDEQQYRGRAAKKIFSFRCSTMSKVELRKEIRSKELETRTLEQLQWRKKRTHEAQLVQICERFVSDAFNSQGDEPRTQILFLWTQTVPGTDRDPMVAAQYHRTTSRAAHF